MSRGAVYVAVRDGIIVGASINDGPKALSFFWPLRRDTQVILVDGPVRIGAHVDEPMVYPPRATKD